MNRCIEDERVWRALEDIAKNLKGLAEAGLPTFPKFACVGLFSTSHFGEKNVEIIVHGIEEAKLRNLISFCNSYEYHEWNRFGKGLGWSVPLDKLMPYIVLCNEQVYKSTMCNRVVTFY